MLAPFAIKLDWEAAKIPSLGIRTASENNKLKLATVYSQGAAQAAGLCAGDILLAIDGLRVTPTSIDRQLARHQPGDSIKGERFPAR